MITVTMEGPEIHIRPTGRLDADAVATITRLLASARATGTEPVLDVSGLAPHDRHRALGLVPTPVTPASVA